jgi:hypothetical protein
MVSLKNLSDKYEKLGDLNMKSKLHEMSFTLVEASAKAKLEKVELEVRNRKRQD